MEIFSPFGFKFGILLFLCICFATLVYCWLCILFQVRIEKFVLLLDPWDKYIFKRKINQTEYILGWLPFGSYIRVFGVYKNNEEINTMIEEEKKYALIYKPKIQQQIFKASPYLIWATLFLLFIYLMNPNTFFFANLQIIFTYAIIGSKSMFGFLQKEEFESYSKAVSNSFQLLPFSLLVCFLAFMILSLLSTFNQMFADDKKSKLKKITVTILTLVLIYMVLWKVPSFAFSFFTFENALRYILSTILGIYFASIITYWLIIPLIRLNKTK